MNTNNLSFVLLSIILFTNTINATESNHDAFMIKNGDRIVFWGDSITVAGTYVKNIESYIRSRYPDYQVHFLTLGWNGGKTQNWQHLERDVLPFQPTIIFIKLGMNDGQYKAFEQPTLDQYLAGMRKLINIMEQQTHARIVFITTIPYEAGIKNDYRGQILSKVYVDTLRQLSEGLIKLAKEYNYPVIDLNQAYLKHLNRYKQAQPTLQFSTDGIHPDATGHALMAFLILQGMNADGNIMFLSVDMETGKVITDDNQRVTDLKTTEHRFTLTRKPLAFPFKVINEDHLKIDIQPWYDQLNRNIIQVTGLKKPFCLLSVNGFPVEVFSKSVLEKGINVARIGTLPEDQVTEFISQLVEEKFEARYQRWRGGITKGIAPNKYAPLLPNNFETKYLYQKGELIANYLNSDHLTLEGYPLTFRALDEYNRYPDAPFRVTPPYPNLEQVQVLFVVDTNPWKNIISEQSPQPLSFKAPLKIKSHFTQWQPLALYDNGTHGDNQANDGKWSLAINMKRENRIKIFAFDDNNPLRSTHESVVMKILKLGLGQVPAIGRNNHPAVIPDKHQIVEITAEHFYQAVAKGNIRIKGNEPTRPEHF